jgi:hypothetical protein
MVNHDPEDREDQKPGNPAQRRLSTTSQHCDNLASLVPFRYLGLPVDQRVSPRLAQLALLRERKSAVVGVFRVERRRVNLPVVLAFVVASAVAEYRGR